MRALRARSAGGVATAGATETTAFVSLAPGDEASDLEAAGMKVLNQFGEIAIVQLPLDQVETMAASKAVRTMQLPRDMKLYMDLAKEETGVNTIHQGGEGLPKAYTGKGVFAGIVDQGIDPHHVNFLDADGNNRIEYLSHIYVSNSGQLVERFYGKEVVDGLDLNDFETDEPTVFHGTHTLGILAGNYTGNVTVCEGVDGTTPVTAEKANPFGGVATGANIAVGSGVLNDIGIAYNMSYLLGYTCDYKKMPTVLNLSVGSNIGPHDKNSMMGKTLSALGKEAIICISAGNEGDMKVHMHKTFEKDDETVQSFIYPYAYRYDPEAEESVLNNTIRYGQIVFYGNDETPFEVQAVIYNKAR